MQDVIFLSYHCFMSVRVLGFRLGLLAVWAFYVVFHRFNVRSLSKRPVLSSEPPKWGKKRYFSYARSAHTGTGLQFVVSVVG